MQPCRRVASLLIAGMLVAGGCVSTPDTDFRPAMPTIVSGPSTSTSLPVAAGPVVADVIAQAERGDVAGARSAFGQLPLWRQREAAPAIARALLARDLNGAAQWANELGDVSARVAAVRAVAETLFQQDAAHAMSRLEAVPLNERRVEFLCLAAAEWARRDSAAAVAWARALEDVELRQRTLTSIAFEVAQHSPEQAIAIADLLPPGRDRGIALAAIGRTWAQRNSAAAGAWARQLPEGEARNAALAGVQSAYDAELMAARSPLGDSRPVSIAPPINVPPPSTYGMTSDEALRREFQQRLERSPALTGDWLATLPPSERRDEFVTKLTHDWMAENPAAAKQWIDQNIPSDARRQQILFEAGVVSSPRPNSP